MVWVVHFPGREGRGKKDRGVRVENEWGGLQSFCGGGKGNGQGSGEEKWVVWGNG